MGTVDARDVNSVVGEELPLSQGAVDGGAVGSRRAVAVAAASQVMQAWACAGVASDWKAQARQDSVLGEGCGRAACEEVGHTGLSLGEGGLQCGEAPILKRALLCVQ